jgi:hypothetical protein
MARRMGGRGWDVDVVSSCHRSMKRFHATSGSLAPISASWARDMFGRRLVRDPSGGGVERERPDKTDLLTLSIWERSLAV